MNVNKTIFVDVDGTLVCAERVNHNLIAWLRVKRSEGHELILWSAQGQKYAQEVAVRLEIAELFSAIISKPGAIIDDKGWAWIKFTRWLRGGDFEF